MSLLKDRVEQVLDIGIGDAYQDDLYHVQVVNLSYVLATIVFTFFAILYGFWHHYVLVGFNVFMAICGCIGILLNHKNQTHKAAILFPLLLAIYIVLNCFVFLGSGSFVHWAMAITAVYSFTAYQSRQSTLRWWSIALSSGCFLLSDLFAPVQGWYLSEGEQTIVSYLTFLTFVTSVSITTNLVVGRLRKANEHLRHLAEIDELTGLANRRKVLADAVNIFADAIINQEPCAFAILDLDHFKKINDTYGHEMGDSVLAHVSQTMATVMSPDYRLGRYGGEEFIIIMPNTDSQTAGQQMDAVRKSIESIQIYSLDNDAIPVTVSIGVAVLAAHTLRYEEILAEADKALYRAKRSGRNRVCL